MNATEIKGRVEAVLANKTGGSVQINSMILVGGGCISEAFKLETTAGTFFMKLLRNNGSSILQAESHGLQTLSRAAKGALVVPKVIAYEDISASSAFLILEYLPMGGAFEDDDKLGRGLAQIHRYRHKYFGLERGNFCGLTPQDNTFKSDWLSFFRDNRIRHLLRLIHLKRGFTVEEQKIYELLLKRLEVLIPDKSIPSLIHGDLWSGNYLFTQNGPALIDPAISFSDREMEFGMITLFGGFSSRFFDAYNEEYPLDSDWKTRNPLYQLYHVLNHYYLFGGGYGQQALHLARKYL